MGANMITVKKINSMEAILGIISEQEYDERIGRFRSSFLYRGLPNENYSLVTSLKETVKENRKN